MDLKLGYHLPCAQDEASRRAHLSPCVSMNPDCRSSLGGAACRLPHSRWPQCRGRGRGRPPTSAAFSTRWEVTPNTGCRHSRGKEGSMGLQRQEGKCNMPLGLPAGKCVCGKHAGPAAGVRSELGCREAASSACEEPGPSFPLPHPCPSAPGMPPRLAFGSLIFYFCTNVWRSPSSLGRQGKSRVVLGSECRLDHPAVLSSASWATSTGISSNSGHGAGVTHPHTHTHTHTHTHPPPPPNSPTPPAVPHGPAPAQRVP